MQVIGALIAGSILLIITYVMYRKRRGERQDAVQYTTKTEETLLQDVINSIAEITRENALIMKDDLEYEAVTRLNREALKALTDAPAGVKSARDFVKSLVNSIIEDRVPTLEEACIYQNFDTPRLLDPMVKWELLIIKLWPKHGIQIINYLEDTYELTKKRVIPNGYSKKPIREFDSSLLDYIFEKEVILATNENEDEPVINYEMAIAYLTQRIYSRYKGPRCADSLMTLKVDGIEFGTSGSIRYKIDGNFDIPYRDTNSVWVQINAKWVLFSFLDFYTEGAMKQSITQLVSWGNSSPMTEKKPFKVTDGWDGSRRTAFRPPAAECWCIFIRNFNLSLNSYQQLLDKPYAKNWEMVAELIHFLIKAEETLPFTGQQNTGKTTLMVASIEDVDCINIRLLEMAFEASLRERYQNKNIITLKPTDYVTSQELQDLLKKSDGWLSMVGEVAENGVAARVIQFKLISSPFTMFSHHAVDDNALVKGFENHLVGSGEFHDHNVARDLVLDAINHNIHLGFTKQTGQRVVEFISQIVKLETTVPYPEMSTLLAEAREVLNSNRMASLCDKYHDGANVNKKALVKDMRKAFAEHEQNELAEVAMAYSMLTREYYTRTTDRVSFESRKIIEYNEQTQSYEPRQWYTPEKTQEIMRKLPYEEKVKFIEFYNKYWRS